MEKITDKIAALPADANYFSLEFFPPKTAMGFSNLRDRLDRMARALRPLFVNVTWGAGGSTATKSLELAEICQRELNLTTCLHLTCTNMSRKMIDGALEDAKALGIRNLLALRGDPPRAAEYQNHNEDPENAIDEGFVWAIDLVKYIKNKYGDYFCIGVAAYPEGHADESHPLGQSVEHDLSYLVDKTLAGADFLMTQLFFDIEAYGNFERRLREHPSGAFATIPIIPGLMPIQSYQMIKRTTKLSHASIPASIMSRLDVVQKDDEKVKNVGVDILCEIIEQVKEIKSSIPGPKGFHFYTLNLEKAVSFIVERTHLISNPTEEDAVVEEGPLPDIPNLVINGTSPRGDSRFQDSGHSRRQSTIGSEPRNRVIVSERSLSNPEYEASQADAGILAGAINTRANTLAISEGEGVLGREATWDDFPNGRWGDARSPAYGEIDGYGPTLHMTQAQAIELWGHPKSREDVDTLFVRHLKGELNAIPWSEEEVHEETGTITDQLIQLNSRGMWTVASQPAVNSIRSEDPTFGWGPKHGFIFQKAFVEFFISGTAWKALHGKLASSEVCGLVTYYAANAAGSVVSSDSIGGVTPTSGATEPIEEDDEGYVTGESSTNAVTWGVFPGKEIVTPTIIEEVSFRAWAEEAFGIFSEWAQVYGKGHESEKFLEATRADCWLVNIIHHDFMTKEALWDLLLK
ncbi:methylenetetrahydrofolate reductase 2 [Astrocystis sublimbata]|nr:methylenetetrahydrofolate reductase 2 [Astrocystis sublimbata]